MDSGYLQFRIKLSKNKWLAYILYWIRAGSSTGLPTICAPYVLTEEKVACKIRQNPRIHGLRPPNSNAEVKLFQFADGTTLLLNDEQSIIENFNTSDLYESASGAKINKGKCKGLWCGAFAQSTDQLFGFDWYNDFIPDKILGQYFGNVDCTQRKWEAKIQKINNIRSKRSHTDQNSS